MIEATRYWQKMRRPVAMVLLCGAAVMSLQGCVGLVVGGAVVGTLAATDRRTIGAQAEDKAITAKGEVRMSRIGGDTAHINVTSFNRKVLLTGEVRDQAMKDAAEREMAAVENVQSVVNELAIMPPASYSTRSNDALLTGKVKASFVDRKDLYANSIKVVTDRGIVYLMGRVSQREGNLAGEVARGVSGVQKVVKVFEYLDEAEIQRMANEPSPPQ